MYMFSTAGLRLGYGWIEIANILELSLGTTPESCSVLCTRSQNQIELRRESG